MDVQIVEWNVSCWWVLATMSIAATTVCMLPIGCVKV